MTGDIPVWPKDKLVRALRAISVLAFIALLFVVILDREHRDPTTIGFLIGAILIQLCYDAIVGVPEILAKRKEGKEGKSE